MQSNPDTVPPLPSARCVIEIPYYTIFWFTTIVDIPASVAVNEQ